MKEFRDFEDCLQDWCAKCVEAKYWLNWSKIREAWLR